MQTKHRIRILFGKPAGQFGCLLGPFTLDELSDLTPDAAKRTAHGTVKFANLGTEKLEHSQKLLARHNRKRESRVQPFSGCILSSREISVLSDVGNPRRFKARPNAARETNTLFQPQFITDVF